jgi:ADP-ribosyl-[dinitrogen reductase] hydrolase
MNTLIQSRFQKARDGMLGALIGDALGVPFEFKRGDQIPAEIDMTMPPEFEKSHSGIPYGTWSDDGAQALCLMESVLRCQKYESDDFCQSLLEWYSNARHQSGGKVFDCGLTTAAALRRIRTGLRQEAGDTGDRSNGNGALMRTIGAVAAGIALGFSENTICRIAAEQSRPTHGHPKSMVTCAVFAKLALAASRSEKVDPDAAIASVRELFLWHPEMLAALTQLALYRQDMPNGGGYVFNAFWSAILAYQQATSYRAAVVAAIRYGNDTDTTACITGALAGLRWGLPVDQTRDEPCIPKCWINQVNFPEESRQLLEMS